ncbi:MAG: hypothetical protein JXB30_09045 [Anaerolineae bacterium]|nr:hypothetical protein [Anaerolineae bacterium]
MNYKIEVVPNEPILMVDLYKHYSFTVDDPVATGECWKILDESDEPMFMIMDVTDLAISLDDLVQAANRDTHGEQPIYHHPKLQELLVVTRSKMIQIAVRGITSVAFGNVNAKAFGTVDEALAYARSQLAAQ